MRQSGPQNEMRARIIPVGFDRPAQPIDRLLFPAELKFGQSSEHAPEVDIPVAGTEAQRLLDVSLGLLGLTEEKLDVANLRVRGSQVSIEFQRPLAGADALKAAIGMHLDHPQQQ